MASGFEDWLLAITPEAGELMWDGRDDRLCAVVAALMPERSAVIF